MIEAALAWLMAHPLETVGALAAFSVAFAFLLVPRVHEMRSDDHPRC